MPDGPREIPPTAGLPLTWHDFLPGEGVSFEAGLAGFLRLPEVQIECSGTACLVVALTALKRASSRRSVVIPAYTCPLVALAIAHCGLTPVLCDVLEDRFDLCPEALGKLRTDDILAVVPTHLGGRVADLASVTKLAREMGASVIEDAAQALGATWRGQPVGSVGDAGFYSLAVGKGLTLYEGGVLFAREKHLRDVLRETSKEVSPYRVTWEIRRLVELAGYTALYRPGTLRLAYGMPLRRALRKKQLIEAVGDDLSTDIPLHRVGGWRRAIGANAVRRLPEFLDTLSAQAIGRKKKLAAIRGMAVIDDTEDGHGTWPYFMVLLANMEARDAALSRLWQSGLGVSRLFIHALPDYPYLAGFVGGAEVPHARDFAARMLTVSNSPWLSDAEFLRICSELSSFT
jgi:dTDP-4-amino-4,6-dideoxygalactose transaminase